MMREEGYTLPTILESKGEPKSDGISRMRRVSR
jgi:hypothetical protein